MINYRFFALFAVILITINLTEKVMAFKANNKKEHLSYAIPADLLLTADSKPTPALEELLTFLKVSHDNSLASIVTQTQKLWLRQPGKERWQVDDVQPESTNQVNNFARKLGLINEIKPSKKQYKYVFILGATFKRMRTRLAYVLKLWEQGITFDHLVFLVSERPLDATIESKEMMLDGKNGDLTFKENWQTPDQLPKTEYEAAQVIYDQSQLPEKFRAIPITFINSKMIKNSDGTMRRATTGDTIIDWLATNPTHGDCLFVSNQPYVGYQDSVMRTYISNSFGFLETCGPQASDTTRNADILDDLARFLYQEKIRREKNN